MPQAKCPEEKERKRKPCLCDIWLETSTGLLDEIKKSSGLNNAGGHNIRRPCTKLLGVAAQSSASVGTRLLVVTQGRLRVCNLTGDTCQALGILLKFGELTQDVAEAVNQIGRASCRERV